MAGAGLALGDPILRQSNEITIAGARVQIVISSISEATVRITALPVDGGRLPADDSLVTAAAGRVVARRRVKSNEAIRAGNLTVRITDGPPAIHVDTAAGKPIQRFTLDAASPDVSFLLGTGPLLGMGEGGPQFDRKGMVDRGRNGQGGYQLLYARRPRANPVVDRDGGLGPMHQPLGAFDLTGSEGRFSPAADAPPLDVFVTASSDPAAIVCEYATITGRAEMPARWTFGYMQSHRTLGGPDEVKWVARTFREKRLPCDALIYLGTEFTPSGWNTRNGEFAWRKENFPNPQQMIDELHAQHFHIVLHAVIEGRRMSGTVHDPCTPDKAVPSGRTPDDKWPDDRAVPCYWPYHKPVYDLGIDGWWPDQGDGLDQPSRLARIRT